MFYPGPGGNAEHDIEELVVPAGILFQKNLQAFQTLGNALGIIQPVHRENDLSVLRLDVKSGKIYCSG